MGSKNGDFATLPSVATGIADTQEYRLILFLCFFKRFISPGEPIHGIIGVLEQIGGFFLDQAIGYFFIGHMITPLINVINFIYPLFIMGKLFNRITI